MASWKKISSKIIYKTPYFNLEEHKVIKPDGRKGVYHVIDEPGAVAIVALDSQNRIYLLHEEKYIPGMIWTTPAGNINRGDKNLLFTAKRELKEETGLTAKKWTSLGEFLIAPGRSNGKGYAFLAQELQEGKQNLDSSEEIKVVKVSFQKAVEMIKKGEIIDAWATIPILKAKLFLDL